MNASDSIVIVGGGHAAAALCGQLAAAGAGPRVQLVCAELLLPYHRPPLSKQFLKNVAEAPLLHRDAGWYAGAGIGVHLDNPVRTIDRERRCVRLASGVELGYAQLVLATGTHARLLPGLPMPLDNVAVLRGAADAERLRGLLAAAAHVTVLGGGYIGLEVAASAGQLGRAVTVLESAPRLLARSVSAELAAHVLGVHRASGIDVRLGVAVGGFETGVGRLQALHVDGVRQAVDLLLLGIGAAPEQALAQAAGLDCDNGIVVDGGMRTSDAAVLAIGDCASVVRDGRRMRLESVQNANEHARLAAATLLAREPGPSAVPATFWSDQGAVRLQMAGLYPHDGAATFRRGADGAAAFSLLHYAGERLACVESVNAPADHLAARRLLEAEVSPKPELACDAGVALKTLVPQPG